MNTLKKKMDFTKLEGVIERLHEIAGSEEGITPTEAELSTAITYLEWLAEFLEDRRMYHKKQSVKKNMAVKLLKTMLSKEELAEVDRQVAKEIGDLHSADDAETDL